VLKENLSNLSLLVLSQISDDLDDDYEDSQNLNYFQVSQDPYDDGI
jgi:hypothetical protein